MSALHRRPDGVEVTRDVHDLIVCYFYEPDS